jgi:hypothetical protein
MHLTSGELLYLLPKTGVIIGKEWGGNGNLTVQGKFTTPLDLTRVDAKMMNVWDDTGPDESYCPDGYYMYGVSKKTFGRGSTFDPACRKLPGA